MPTQLARVCGGASRLSGNSLDAGTANLEIGGAALSRKTIAEQKRGICCFKTYLLLAGFALENTMKGLLIVKEPNHITTGVLSHELKTHDLIALAAQLPSKIGRAHV